MEPRILRVLLVALGLGLAQPNPVLGAALPGTEPLTAQGDLSAGMVAGIDAFFDAATERAAQERAKFWNRDFSSPAAYEKSIATNRARLRQIIGATEPRVSFHDIEFTANTARNSIIAESDTYAALTIRWPVFERVHGEGIWLRQKGKSLGVVICLPDADQTPEQLCGLTEGIPADGQFARKFAQQGLDVFVPVLINRSDKYSGNEEISRFTNQPHREWIYRQAYELGYHIIGYEVQKVEALLDWIDREKLGKIAVAGYGEGGLIAFYSAALDTRVQAALVSGYFGLREKLWEEPIYRNVFGLLEQFGDAEIASLIAPRLLVVEHSPIPQVNGPPAAREGRSGAAPGKLVAIERYEAEDELDRAREFFPKRFPVEFELVHGQEGVPVLPGSLKAVRLIMEEFGGTYKSVSVESAGPRNEGNLENTEERQRRQVRELVDHTQRLITRVERERETNFWQAVSKAKSKAWQKEGIPYTARFWEEWIGRLPPPDKALNPKSRQIYDEPTWTGHEVTLNVYSNVFAWGILCVPKDLQPGERRPVVVCQHGLEGIPSDTIDGPNTQGYGPYKSFTARLAEHGFITFAPHNPYRGQDKFRVLQRKANPLGKSLFSMIIAQHEQILNWLETLPFVDKDRIGFYGLSYGGKTAMRVPAVLDRYALSICSADFNDWIRKNATVHSRYSYLYTGEYEMPEFALGRMWNYAEMAALIAPRPFMVERGHDDGVAPDEWVAYEFAKVRRFYDKLGVGDRTEIEFFDGPHTINGVGTFKFLHRHLNWPEPK